MTTTDNGHWLRLIEQGGPFVIVTAVLAWLIYLGWRHILKPMMDSSSEQMKNHVIASQNHVIAAQANERLG